MYLDKEKLKSLLKKTEDLKFDNNHRRFNQQSKSSQEKVLGSIVSGLSTWLIKHSNLTNGTSYGKKLAEIKTLFISKTQGQISLYFGEAEGKPIQTKLVNLIKTIDKENKTVFIVHGRDEKMLDDIKSALGNLGIYSVILNKENNSGQTIIEKFEKGADQCEYAVVLCSADDEGRLRQKGRKANEAPLLPRARQNVILELGYFLAKFGRKNLFVLHPEESIEQPSDFHGMAYETFDKGGNWKIRLVRELRVAGFKISATLADRI